MKTHTITHAQNGISTIIREAEKEEVLISRYGKPAAVVIGFHDDDDWFDYRLEHDATFLSGIATAREEIRKGKFVALGDLSD
ncbi:MAG: hypothetical protein AUJ92_05185 [Armatimonadetes bacterium CG2_30_59_28]|nr:type II toxin-antitoxin system Phd/YefM family antitoxin [Armatimonadota bacterium]OIO96827.1 MAG: hypothetical protein AUJ92_05185 [Armatimonadetes bacterium CG2_30_59_28]PIU62200.1 MAG: prevent-host-death protein [Armatimonadetes bacterium CG07_land_8_20_14_0_80_59_28]PJB66175.1 MAG: prevent-host-death protein [Armatimonadetes bacterium CG_4_9_14_3_um_filter_58_7]